MDAFSACLRNRALPDAVELLEQGRGVFWSQLARLRLPLDDVIASGPAGNELADEFTRLTSHIRSALNSPGSNEHDRLYLLNTELKCIVTRQCLASPISFYRYPSLTSKMRQVEGPLSF